MVFSNDRLDIQDVDAEMMTIGRILEALPTITACLSM